MVMAVGGCFRLMRSPDILTFMRIADEVVTGMKSGTRDLPDPRVLRASVRHPEVDVIEACKQHTSGHVGGRADASGTNFLAIQPRTKRLAPKRRRLEAIIRPQRRAGLSTAPRTPALSHLTQAACAPAPPTGRIAR
jgi:hypothetical protein